MASNSDTIYHVLSYIKAHPDKVMNKPAAYDNVVEMYLDDTVKLGNPEIYFPKQKLEVNRMSTDFMSMYSDLLDYFHDKTKVKDSNYHELWITTSHLVDRHKYLVDLSFE
ncbi:hypothetical protein LASUN_11490 [Lentilactobacillus sunkii]|uniref:Uncharacterized protein n=1 Tax=Lentilactobacillus sunkii TaxID=481719 RepID=A0A1E7XD93_9LACO|nr:hypothetical protein [Lentilactobacillus sunkii]OFA11077.1 hypothetical protein LASUN_11490 [Lentilactobacillus sunkii]